MAYMHGEEGCRCLAPYPPASPGYESRVPDTNACFFFSWGGGVSGPRGARVDIFIHKGGGGGKACDHSRLPGLCWRQQSPSKTKQSSAHHLSEVAMRGGMGGGGVPFCNVHGGTSQNGGRARTDFLASSLPRAQEAPRCRDSFAGRRSPSGKIVPDSHSHGHPRVGCTLIVPSSIKWALLQSSYASPGSFSEIRDCENVHTCGCFTVTNFRE